MTIHRTPFHRFGSLLGLLAGIVLWSWVAPVGATSRANAAWQASPSEAPGHQRAPISPSSEPESDDDDERGDDLVGVVISHPEVAPPDQTCIGHHARSLEARAGHRLLPERPPRS